MDAAINEPFWTPKSNIRVPWVQILIPHLFPASCCCAPWKATGNGSGTWISATYVRDLRLNSRTYGSSLKEDIVAEASWK